MKNSFGKSWKVVAASLVLLTSLFGQVTAYDNYNSCDSCCPCEDECGKFIVGADWLYWQTNACGLSYGNLTTIRFSEGRDSENVSSCGQLKNLSFDWDSGVRLYAGWREPCGKWDGMLKWTHLNTSASGSVANDISSEGVENGSIFIPSWGAPFSLFALFELEGGGEQKSSAKWRMNLDMVDLELGREFLVCDCAALRPHIGLRYVKLDQKYSANSELSFNAGYRPGILSAAEDFENTASQKVSAKNNFEGVGLRGGLDADWCFGCFSVYGNAGASLVYGRFDVSLADEASQNDLGSLESFRNFSVKQSNHFHATRPISDLGLGVRWDQSLDCDRMNLSIKLGWEHHYFWDQNSFIRSGSVPFSGEGLGVLGFFGSSDDCSKGGIGTQGLTLSASLEF